MISDRTLLAIGRQVIEHFRPLNRPQPGSDLPVCAQLDCDVTNALYNVATRYDTDFEDVPEGLSRHETIMQVHRIAKEVIAEHQAYIEQIIKDTKPRS